MSTNMSIKDSGEYFYSSPDEVESVFYDALSEGDINLLEGILADENVSYSHAGNEFLHGRMNVINHWFFLFEGIYKIRVSYQVLHRTVKDNTETHVVSEVFKIPNSNGCFSETLTTNIYVEQENGWRLQLQKSTEALRLDGYSDINEIH